MDKYNIYWKLCKDMHIKWKDIYCLFQNISRDNNIFYWKGVKRHQYFTLGVKVLVDYHG